MADKNKQAAKAAKTARKAGAGDPALPKTRAALLDLHRETRARRNAAPHGSPEHVEAIQMIARIEIEIARIERAADPPLG